jgi:hypothetical protein
MSKAMKPDKTRHTQRSIEWRPPAEQSAAEAEAYERAEEWGFISRVFRLARPRPVPQRLKRHSVWRTLVNLGMSGALAHVLNGGPPPGMVKYVLEVARGLRAKTAAGVRSEKDIMSRLKADPRLIPELGHVLAWLFKTGGWLGVQFLLLQRQPPTFSHDAELRELWMEALKESILFERCGFVVARCDHGQHCYASDDLRRKDCPQHRLAGQQARWRKRHPEWKRRKRDQ